MNCYHRSLLDMPDLWRIVDKYASPNRMDLTMLGTTNVVTILYENNSKIMFGDHMFRDRAFNRKYFDPHHYKHTTDGYEIHQILHTLIEPHQVTTQHILPKSMFSGGQFLSTIDDLRDITKHILEYEHTNILRDLLLSEPYPHLLTALVPRFMTIRWLDIFLRD